MNKNELMNKIQALSFAMVETQLFLDTHPECKAALDYYNKVTVDYDKAMTEYQNMHGPICADANPADRWAWIEGPWPWQAEDGVLPENPIGGNGNMKAENKGGRAK